MLIYSLGVSILCWYCKEWVSDSNDKQTIKEIVSASIGYLKQYFK